jgi:hypothetical protein
VKPSVYDLAQHGPVLATRDTGKAAGRQIADQLGDAQALILGFWGIEVASPAFLDEMLRAISAVLQGGRSQKILVAAGINEDVREALELVLQHRGGVMAELEAGQLRLLGGSRQLKETLKKAQEMGFFTAPQLAERLAVKLPNLHARLKQLAEAGAVARADAPAAESAEAGRRAGAYRAPDPQVLTAV